jgi:hypothetical protein
LSLVFVDRAPTQQELERLRLVLSTYQDGSGMLMLKDGTSLPGWRDFERAVASVFGGTSQENKAIFDVLLPDSTKPGISYGLSCKMRATLERIGKDGRVTIELSNSARKFWEYLGVKGIDQSNYRNQPREVGMALVQLIRRWHEAVSISVGGVIDLAKSSYLVLSYSKRGVYQLHQFALDLPDPSYLDWSFPRVSRRGIVAQGNHLRGSDDIGTLFEWYGESGGQLKYYPPAGSALWRSELFSLEPLKLEHTGLVLMRKAEAYFPELWLANLEP